MLDDKDRLLKGLQEIFENTMLGLDPKNWKLIQEWEAKRKLIQGRSIYV